MRRLESLRWYRWGNDPWSGGWCGRLKGGVTLIEYFNEDCMVGMKRYKDKHFHLAIC